MKRRFFPIDRRAFLRTTGLGLAAAVARFGPVACTEAAEEIFALADTGPDLPGGIPFSLMTASRDEVDLQLRVLSGRLPRDLQGHIFIAGALPWNDGAPLFNGDGIMYRVDFGDGDPKLKSRIAKTPCFYADHATQGTDLGFVNVGITRMSRSLGVRNELNTAFVAMGHRLLVTYDGGRPYEVDPNTLELITPVGPNSAWHPALPEFMSSGPFTTHFSTAHPYYDEHTQELLTLNYGPEIEGRPPFLRVLTWDGERDPVAADLVDEDGDPISIHQSVHQFAVTRDYLVIVDCAFLVEIEQIFNPDYAEAQNPNSRLFIVKRADLASGRAVARELVVPMEMIHLTADYENPNGEITLHVSHNNGSDGSEWLREGDTIFTTGEPIDPRYAGLIPSGTDINVVGRHIIDGETGRLVSSQTFQDESYTWGLAFHTYGGHTAPGRFESVFFNSIGYEEETLTQRLMDLYGDHPHRHVPVSAVTGSRAPTLFRFDPINMRIADGYTFPPGRMGSSPQYVPRPNARHQHDGYLVCTVISDDTRTEGSSGNEVWVFDATDIAQGPLVRLGHPALDIGFTLHTAYMPELTSRGSSYRVSVREDYAEKLASANESIVALFNDHVFPNFES